MKKAVIIGASTGIGKELASLLHANGWALGLTARRLNLLEQLKSELEGEGRPAVHVSCMDVARPQEAMATFEALIKEMGGMELAIVNAGVGFYNKRLKWVHEANTINVNVTGFAAMAGVAWRHFVEQKSGHLVGMSSVACVRGSALVPAYNASKAFVSNYLEGLRVRAKKIGPGLAVTDVRPGFVDTPMTEGQKGMFWVAPADKAARQMYAAIARRRKVVYVTKRWWLVAAVLKRMPDFVYAKL